MSIQSEITRIETAKNDIITSLQNKGSDIETGSNIDVIPSFIDKLSAGGSLVMKATSTAIADNPKQFVCNIKEKFDLTKKNWFILGRMKLSASGSLNIYFSPTQTLSIVTAKLIGAIKSKDSTNMEGTFLIKPTGFLDTLDGKEIVATIPADSYQYFGFYNPLGSNTNILSGSTIQFYCFE